MSKVDKLQERHDNLLDQIEKDLKTLPIRESEIQHLLSLVNKYGDTCIKLVEAEHEECGS